MDIIVTGGAGYIGSHTVTRLIEQGHSILVVDDLSSGFRQAIDQRADFIQCDINNLTRLLEICSANRPTAIVHFAGKLNVSESSSDPLKYYRNNVLGLSNVIEAMCKFSIGSLVFSSTAAVYGNPTLNRLIGENEDKRPINPYGESKLFCEMIIERCAKLHGFKYCNLRYFNVAGAADNGKNGQRTPHAFHLIHLASKVATGNLPYLQIFGTDYPTEDGTCVRDYIHVEDLADVHALALSYIQKSASRTFNCGYGIGYSVKEVVTAMREVSGRSFEVRIANRRNGDPSVLVSDPRQIIEMLNWKPKRNDLRKICESAFRWEREGGGNGRST